MQNSRRRCGAEHKNGDPWENRTPDFAVRGRRLSRLTKGPYFGEKAGFSPNKEKSRHLPIFPGRLQPSIFGTTKLNFCVRNGNRWDLTVIDTDRSDWFSITHRALLVQCFLEGRAFKTEQLLRSLGQMQNLQEDCGQALDRLVLAS